MTGPISGSADDLYPKPARSVARMLVDRVDATPRREAVRIPTDHGWESLTWEQVGQQAFDLAAGLLALGSGNEQRVAIICSTRYEWILADLAVMCSGGATTTVYPSTDPTTWRSSSPTPAAESSSPRTPNSSASCGRSGSSCPRREGCPDRRRGRRRLGDVMARPGPCGRRPPARTSRPRSRR